MTRNPMNAKRRRFQFSIRSMLIAFLVVALILGAVPDYGSKLMWRLGWDLPLDGFKNWRPSHIRSTPVSVMPEVSPELLQEDWIDYRVSSLGMSLPRGMTVWDVKGRSRVVELRSADWSVTVVLPADDPRVFEVRRNCVSEFPSARELSQAELRAAAYGTGWDDFRWSMSHEEFLWHRWLLTTGQELRFASGFDRVETLFRDGIEGLLSVSAETACFELYSTQGATAGYLTFEQRDGPLKIDWVRRVCQSLEFSGQRCPEEISEAELLELIGPIEDE